MKRNKDLDELGISRRAYLATLVKERKLLHLFNAGCMVLIIER